VQLDRRPNAREERGIGEVTRPLVEPRPGFD
jgi:hypothetical protein